MPVPRGAPRMTRTLCSVAHLLLNLWRMSVKRTICVIRAMFRERSGQTSNGGADRGVPSIPVACVNTHHPFTRLWRSSSTCLAGFLQTLRCCGYHDAPFRPSAYVISERTFGSHTSTLSIGRHKHQSEENLYTRPGLRNSSDERRG